MNRIAKQHELERVAAMPRQTLLVPFSVAIGRKVIDDRRRSLRRHARVKPRISRTAKRQIWRAHVDSSLAWRGLWRWVVVVALGLAVGSIAVDRLDYHGPAWWIDFRHWDWFGVVRVGVMLAAWGAVCLMMWSIFSLGAWFWRDLCVRARQCAACGYPIGDLPPADDGCTVCPECGGAWRLPAVERG